MQKKFSFLFIFLVTVFIASPALAEKTQSAAHFSLHSSKSHAAVCKKTKVGFAHCTAQVITDESGTPAASTGPMGYGPAQFLKAYNLTGVASGTPIIAIVDAYDNPTIAADLSTYSTQYGIPQLPVCSNAIASSTVPCFQKVSQTGSTSSLPAVNNSWAIESSLDVEAAHAICQNCKIILVEANSASLSDLGTAVNTAVSLGANVVSNSYGALQFSSEAFYNSYFNHPGVAITVSSGDAGYGVQFPASSPYVTAVGGTTLNLNPDGSYASEGAWSGAGSGCSSYQTKPSWQKDGGCTGRTVADVAADADPSTGAAVYQSFGYASSTGWLQVGGTSLASPLIAGVYALAGTMGSSTQENALPYSGPAGSLRDVTFGSNGSCSGSYLCTAIAGFDGPTGLGTPNGTAAFGVASPIASPAPTATLSASPASLTQGQSSTLTWTSANATSCAGNNFSTGNAVSGSVSVSPTTTSTYAISCTGAGGSASATTTITVSSVATSTPLGYWTFDTTSFSGLTENDSSGNNLSGALMNYASATTIPGKVAEALSFNGTNQYVKLYNGTVAGAPAALKTFANGDRTMSAWIKTTQISPASPYGWTCGAVVMEGRSYPDDSPYGWAFGASNNKVCYSASISGNTYQTVTGNAVINDGNWHLITITLTGSSGTIYVDGTVDKTFTQTIPLNNSVGQTSNSVSIGIGARARDTGAQDRNFFGGGIDDLRIYNRALSASEVQALYASGTSSPPTPTANLTADPTTVFSGATSTLTWSSTNATSCTGTNFTTNGALSGSVSVFPATTTTYAITCGSATAAATVTVQASTPTPGLVGYWALDNSASDGSGNGNNGMTVGSPVYTTGKMAQALTLNGTSQYVNLLTGVAPANVPAAFKDIANNNSYTFSAWIKTSATSPASPYPWTCGQVIVEARNASTAYSHGWAFGLSGNKLCTSRTTNYTTGQTLSGSKTLNDGQWHQVAAVVSTNAVTFYVDGVQDAITSFTTSGAIGNAPVGSGSGSVNMQLGVRSRDGGQKDANFFNGTLDDVRIYNRALSAQEVEALYSGN